MHGAVMKRRLAPGSFATAIAISRALFMGSWRAGTLVPDEITYKHGSEGSRRDF